MIISQTAFFKKNYKKLNTNQRKDVNGAIEKVIGNPKIGKQKTGELGGFCVYKFSCVNQQHLLAYEHQKGELIFHAVGSHENFYRDLKKSLKN